LQDLNIKLILIIYLYYVFKLSIWKRNKHIIGTEIVHEKTFFDKVGSLTSNRNVQQLAESYGFKDTECVLGGYCYK
jgi:hypothetical protein